MAATVLQNVLVEYDYPIAGQPPNSRQVSGSVAAFNSFAYQSSEFVILSDNVAQSGNDIEGFLYVPTLDANSTCDNATRPYIPSNVTRLSNLPSQNDFSVVAFGPWTTPPCVQQYLSLARNAQVKAFYTFLPLDRRTNAHDQAYSQGVPPNATDPAWDLGDNNNWKTTNGFPVYAINAGSAQALMSVLVNYSGPLSSAPNAMNLEAAFPESGATIRLYTDASVPNGSTLPSLWVFLLIVLGILIAVLLIASIAMRVIQKRRRRELQRMIANGEVNLEQLGVARIKVTDEILNNMPICIYVEHGGTPGPAHAPPAEPASETPDATAAPGGRLGRMLHREQAPAVASTGVKLPSKIEEKSVLFPQDTCPICIDEYETHVTPVRWLQCSHIFHPACIDPLLREYSSLCPICKASVLPKDYIPEVTNVMVRRERLNRRFRDIEQRERERERNQPNMPAHFSGLGRFVRVNNENEAQPQTQAQTPEINVEDVEMQRIQPAATTPAGPSEQRPVGAQRNQSSVSVASGARRPENVSREEWARQRAATFVGTSETVEQAEQREEARRPMWRRVLGPAFPTLR